MTNKKLSPIHPGEIFDEEFLKGFGITPYRLAQDISVPPRRVDEIMRGMRTISADTALRPGRYFGISPQFWLNLRARYNLAQEEEAIGGRLNSEVRVYTSIAHTV